MFLLRKWPGGLSGGGGAPRGTTRPSLSLMTEGDDAASRELDGRLNNVRVDTFGVVACGDLVVDLPGVEHEYFGRRVRLQLSMIAHTCADPFSQPHALRGVWLLCDVRGQLACLAPGHAVTLCKVPDLRRPALPFIKAQLYPRPVRFRHGASQRGGS